MKLIFLDIDGVLVLSSRSGFNKKCLLELKRIVNVTNAKIVLSSCWRLFDDSRKIVSDVLKSYNIPTFIGYTHCRKTYTPRATEILVWLGLFKKKHKVDGWIAIDDIDLLSQSHLMKGHFVHCDPQKGLTKERANLAIQLLMQSDDQNQPKSLEKRTPKFSNTFYKGSTPIRPKSESK